MIVTAGAIDCHVHFICPQLAFEAITSGEVLSNDFVNFIWVTEWLLQLQLTIYVLLIAHGNICLISLLRPVHYRIDCR